MVENVSVVDKLTQVWYFKPGSNIDFVWECNVELGKIKLPVTLEDLKKTHTKIYEFSKEHSPDVMFNDFNMWTEPDCESLIALPAAIYLDNTVDDIIQKNGLSHTSMSVGDAVYYPKTKTLFLCKSAGWKKIQLK